MRNLRKQTEDWGELFKLFMADRAATCRPRTLRYYRLQWGTWSRFSNGEAPTKERCQAFLVHLAQTCNPNGVLAVWRGVRTIFNFAYEEGLSMFDPGTVKSPRPLRKQKEPLSNAQCRALLKACLNPRDKALVTLLLDTGLRSGEVCALAVADVDFENREVRVLDGKGGKQRAVPFSGATLRVLRRWEHVREPESPWFFHNVDSNYGTQLSTVYMSHCLARIGKRAGIYPLGPHRLRHTFGRLYIASGGDSAHLQRLMGHESISMTMQYVKLSGEDLRRGHDRFSPMARLLFGEDRQSASR